MHKPKNLTITIYPDGTIEFIYKGQSYGYDAHNIHRALEIMRDVIYGNIPTIDIDKWVQEEQAKRPNLPLTGIDVEPFYNNLAIVTASFESDEDYYFAPLLTKI